MSRQDGGPAFPVQDPQAIHDVAFAAVSHIEDANEREAAYIKARADAVGGASLRDYFAAQALSGILSRPVAGYSITYLEHATHAYKYADAMLAAREVQP